MNDMSLVTFITGSSTGSWQPSRTADTTALSYWLNWRVALCLLWVLMPVVFASALISRHECRCQTRQHETECRGFLYDDQVWLPCLENIHPGWLLGFRVFAFFVPLIMLVLNVVIDGKSIFYFYTQWTFALLTFYYFGLGSILSLRGCYRYRSDPFDNEQGVCRWMKGTDWFNDAEHREKAGFLSRVFQIIFQMNAGAVVLTDTVFWFIIVPFLATKDYNLNFLIVNMHSINAIFLLGDTALNSLRFPWFRMAYFLLWTTTYVIFLWIVHACVPLWWPYPFLDLSSTYAPLLYSTVALMHAPCYGIFALIVKGKHCWMSKRFPRTYRGVQL